MVNASNNNGMLLTVEINEWWAGNTDQRYWMEITGRSDLGGDLFAPTTQQGGRPYWGYELITHVQAGDIVLHWHKSLLGEPAIVGWSIATGFYEDTDISWQARGTVGRARGTLDARPAWRMPLEGYTPFVQPLTVEDVRTHDEALRRVQADLEGRYTGSLYFPFGFSDRRPLRAQQTYFVKMPREVLEELDLLNELDAITTPAPLTRREGRAPKRAGAGYLADAAVRSAIEWWAVAVAWKWYEDNGFDVRYVGNTEPYDLVATKNSDVRRVEVKGSSGAATKVELTAGEVRNAQDFTPTDLVVVDGVEWVRAPDGSVEAHGGEVRRWADWIPDMSALTVTRFRYALPGGGLMDSVPH
jgi:hypothetical protein